MAALPNLIFYSVMGVALIALGLIPGLFQRFLERLSLFASQLGSIFFYSPPVPMRKDWEKRNPVWLAFAGAACIAAGVAQYLLA